MMYYYNQANDTFKSVFGRSIHKLIVGLVLYALFAEICGSAVIKLENTETKYGPCIGVTAKEDPEFKYAINGRNAILFAAFLETIKVPMHIYYNNAKCPVNFSQNYNWSR